MSKLKFPDEYWAVFNCHVNNAKVRALAVCKARYGEIEELGQALEDLERLANGRLMLIFQHKPDPVTELFASCCFIFANGLDKEPERVAADKLWEYPE